MDAVVVVVVVVRVVVAGDVVVAVAAVVVVGGPHLVEVRGWSSLDHTLPPLDDGVADDDIRGVVVDGVVVVAVDSDVLTDVVAAPAPEMPAANDDTP